MKKYFAELVGTFILVLFGCGTAVVAGDKVGILGIAFAFGLGTHWRRLRHWPHLRMPHQPGRKPGCLCGRTHVAQRHVRILDRPVSGRRCLAAWVLSVIVSGIDGGYNIATSGLGQDGWGPGYQGGYNLTSAIVFEFVATLIFVIVILGSTQKSAPAGFAGLAIGITLVAIHIFGIHITGVSVNPARSLGPALLVGGKALAAGVALPSGSQRWAAPPQACCFV